MRKVAVVFAGQGSHSKGLPIVNLISKRPSKSWRTYTLAVQYLEDNFATKIDEVIRENPTSALLCGKKVTHPNGVLNLTSFTQPAMLLYQLCSWLKVVEDHPSVAANVRAFAGHSLGEFSALAAMRIFSPEIAAAVVLQRGQLMEQALRIDPRSSGAFKMYAVSPKRASLSESEFVSVVELIARKVNDRPRVLEIVNYNIVDEQYVVAGDNLSLAAVGKCLDAQWRAGQIADGFDALEQLVSRAVGEVEVDTMDGVSNNPNAPLPEPEVVGSKHRARKKEIFQRPDVSMDGGMILPESHLTSLSKLGDGRSGLKKKSWFIPLPVDVPFHSSVLRRSMDGFYDVLAAALPSQELLEAKLSETSIVVNVTGSVFSAKSEEYRSQLKESVISLNIGEQQHEGRYAPAKHQELIRLCDEGNTRELMLVTLTAQLAHAVQWTDVMETLVGELDCQNILEISPSPTLGEMFRKTFSNAEKNPTIVSTDKEAETMERRFGYDK